MTTIDDATFGGTDELAAARALAKLRTFIEALEDDERVVLAALLAPGVARAYTDGDAADTEVVGFGMQTTTLWSPDRLSDSLAARVRSQHVRVEFDRE